jgi:hypothetical protein
MTDTSEVFSRSRRSTSHPLWLVAWAVIMLLAVGFIGKFVFHYYLNYNAEGFEPYWPRRFWLLLHITGGMVALLVGPWQFWTGLREIAPQIHRWTGRLFLAGVACGVLGAAYLAITTTYGWAFGLGLGGLAVAWTATTGMAFYAIQRGAVVAHKEWTIRAYVVTFAFVTFRLIVECLPTSPEGDRFISAAWLSWSLPLLAAIVIQSLAALRRRPGARAGA